MFRFRAQRKDNGEWVGGWYVESYGVRDGIRTNSHCIATDGFHEYHEVHPHTLSISTGKLDSNDQEIFASFEVDGIMTEGGDVVRIKGYNNRLYVQFDLRTCGFVVIDVATDTVIWSAGILNENFTIIGKQGGN